MVGLVQAVTVVAATFSLDPEKIMKSWPESRLMMWFTFARDHTDKRSLSEALDIAAATWDPETLEDRLPDDANPDRSPPDSASNQKESASEALKRAEKIRQMEGRGERPDGI